MEIRKIVTMVEEFQMEAGQKLEKNRFAKQRQLLCLKIHMQENMLRI